MPDAHDNIAQRILDEIKSNLGQAWDQTISEQQRQLLANVANDAAGLTLAAMAGPRTEQFDRMLLREKAQINAQLMNLAAAEASRLQSALWGAVRTVIGGAIQLIFAA